MTLALPTRDPDYELVIPESGTGLDELEFTGGVTIPAVNGTVDVGEDEYGLYITPASDSPGSAARFTTDGSEYESFPDAVQIGMEFICQLVHLGGPTQGNAGAYFRAGLPLLRMFHQPGVPENTANPYSYSIITGNQDFYSGGMTVGYRRLAILDTLPVLNIEASDPYAGTADPLEVPAVNPFGTDSIDAGSPWYLQLDQGPYHEIRCYAARVWIITVEPPSTTFGMWGLRQRQSLAGNAGGFPLRQRQNGGHTGGWPLRQRQIGL